LIFADASVNETQKYENADTSPEFELLPKSVLSEFEFLLIAGLQIGALKSLGAILGANKFIELLLVPQLTSDSFKSPTKSDPPTVNRDGDLQVNLSGPMTA